MVDRVDTAKASQLFTKEEVQNAGFKDVEMNEFEGGVNTSDAKIVKQYFHYYAKLQNQQNMLQDEVRTTLYRNAILENAHCFEGKVVLDVGCGSGILSLFAAQAGARKVYAIEASNVAESARLLAAANNLDGVITVIQAKIEDITSATIPFNSVDIIVSEPIGTYLLNERMLETYVIARDKFLKPDGRMFPKSATLYIAPFEDSEIYNEQLQKCDFWGTTDFYGLDLSVLKEKSITEKFSQPILDTYNPKKK